MLGALRVEFDLTAASLANRRL